MEAEYFDTFIDENRYSCQKCEFHAVNKDNLKLHHIYAHGEKCFKCDKCEY